MNPLPDDRGDVPTPPHTWGYGGLTDRSWPRIANTKQPWIRATTTRRVQAGMKVSVVDMTGWSTARLLMTAARLSENRDNQRLRSNGITPAGLTALRVLRGQRSLNQVELARLVRVQTQTIGRILERLESRGFVERNQCATDRRVRQVIITPAGRKILRQVEHHKTDAIESDGLSHPALREALINIVRSTRTDLQR